MEVACYDFLDSTCVVVYIVTASVAGEDIVQNRTSYDGKNV